MITDNAKTETSAIFEKELYRVHFLDFDYIINPDTVEYEFNNDDESLVMEAVHVIIKNDRAGYKSDFYGYNNDTKDKPELYASFGGGEFEELYEPYEFLVELIIKDMGEHIRELNREIKELRSEQ